MAEINILLWLVAYLNAAKSVDYPAIATYVFGDVNDPISLI